MMKMATGEGFPSRLVFGAYGGFWQRNSRSRLFSGGFCIYRNFWCRSHVKGGSPSRPRDRGPRLGGRARPHPRGALVAPLTDFFHLYMSIYPQNIEENNRSGVPPLQASVATKNQSGPCSGTPPEVGDLNGGHLHHPGALHDEEGVVHPRG